MSDVIDLFCGIGGFSAGAKLAGMNLVGVADVLTSLSAQLRHIHSEGITMRIRSHTTHTHTHTLTTDNDIDLELTFEPVGDPLVHQVGNKISVAYMVQDDSASNPMTERDGQGKLYTRSQRYGGGVITDNDSEFYFALGLDSGGNIGIGREFPADAPWIDHNGSLQTRTTLRDLAADEFLLKFKGDPGRQQLWLEHLNTTLVEGKDYDIDLKALHRDLVDCDGYFWEEIDDLAVSLYPKYWERIAGFGVVPVDYCESNHGPGTTSVGTTTWNGDIDDFPTGVWVADDDVMGNLVAYPPGVEVGQIKLHTGMFSPEYELTDKGVRVHQGTLGECWTWMKASYTITAADRERALVKYAEAVLDEYENWCNGDVYGCTVELFALVDGEWVEAEGSRENESWGFFGSEYAEKALKDEFFDPAVAALNVTIGEKGHST